ncbi:MAG: MFS transporter [Anaerolineales bacterium]|nr:MFS transporter [Chloroflexota bacterium]MBL6981642.1 MFS transporter [Anaerolineales bacterium]
MTSTRLTTPPQEKKSSFKLGQALTIVSGHFVHDTYSAFVAPLLPLIIEKFTLTLAQATRLTALIQLPSILNPLIGYAADKISLRYFIIFAPATTATLIGVMGLAPNYLSLSFLFLLIGFSTAAFHAPAPAMIARISGKRIGMGMSLFMAAGELGRTLGPIIAISAVAAWKLDGIYRLIVIGWASSFVLLWRFSKVSSKAHLKKPGSLRALIPTIRLFWLPLLVITIARSFLTASITTLLPTFLKGEGATLAMAGISLAILEAAGVVGALVSGTISDQIGRKPALLVLFSASAILLFVFLGTQGWFMYPVLLLLGFASLAPQPVLLALVQDQFAQNRATANGFYMSMSFLVRFVALNLLGLAGDAWGLRITFSISGIISLIAIPAILMLPKLSKPNESDEDMGKVGEGLE